MDLDETAAPVAQTSERRRAVRAQVAGIAVMQSGAQAPSVWRVSNLSLGGAGLVGDGTLAPGRHLLCLHVAGFPALDLQAKVLRRQVMTRGGRCAVKFLDVTGSQAEALQAMMAADHTAAPLARRALVVTADDVRARALTRELGHLGFSVRREKSAGQAVAWMQREETEALLVDESVVGMDRWNVLQFVHDTAPETRRLVIANDVRGFRLYYAIKAGLVEGLIEPSAASAGEALARHLSAAPAVGDRVSPRRARSSR
jgi:ActR/RegA family two-component response regulator